MCSCVICLTHLSQAYPAVVSDTKNNILSGSILNEWLAFILNLLLIGMNILIQTLTDVMQVATNETKQWVCGNLHHVVRDCALWSLESLRSDQLNHWAQGHRCMFPRSPVDRPAMFQWMDIKSTGLICRFVRADQSISFAAWLSWVLRVQPNQINSWKWMT